MEAACCATLVGYYGDKPAELVACVDALHTRISRACPGFAPYALAQVHATLVGLEGEREAAGLINANFRRLRGEPRRMQLVEALRAVRESERWPMQLQLGGFEEDVAYPFASRGQHPYRRAFSLQGERAVMIAWPAQGGAYPRSLAQLRHALAVHGVLHKYHPQLTAADNDLFFVLGTVPASLPPAARAALEQQGRELLRDLRVALRLELSDLSVVQYADPALPLETSVARRLAQVTAAELERLARQGW